MSVSAFRAPQQGATQAALNATKIEKVKDNLYVITGSGVANRDAFSGGNTAVFITDRGVVLVDTKLPGWGQAILDRIKTVTNKPVTTIINTHTHNDHTGSNEFFGATVENIVHENTRTNMVKMDEFKGGQIQIPRRRRHTRTSFRSALERIKSTSIILALAIPTATRSSCSRPSGRCIQGTCSRGKRSRISTPRTAEASSRILRRSRRQSSTLQNVDTVITGHTPVLTWNELKEYADFNGEFVDVGAGPDESRENGGAGGG